MSYQQKKADSVDVGLLKEGDNAQFQFFSLPANPAFPDIRERPIACSYYI